MPPRSCRQAVDEERGECQRQRRQLHGAARCPRRRSFPRLRFFSSFFLPFPLLIFFLFSFRPCVPPPRPRSAAEGRRRSRAALGAGGPAARGAPGAAHGARGRTGRGRDRRGRDGGAARLPALPRFPPLPPSGWWTRAAGTQFKRGVLHRSSRRKEPALGAALPPLSPIPVLLTCHFHSRRAPKSQVLVKKSLAGAGLGGRGGSPSYGSAHPGPAPAPCRLLPKGFEIPEWPRQSGTGSCLLCQVLPVGRSNFVTHREES